MLEKFGIQNLSINVYFLLVMTKLTIRTKEISTVYSGVNNDMPHITKLTAKCIVINKHIIFYELS